MNSEPADPRNRFALLRHDHQGSHWDFFLENEGVLHTWALSELPAQGLEVRARKLPDHRLLYLDYEGPISGDRGHVSRVDAGTYIALNWTHDLLTVKLQGALWKTTAQLCRQSTGPRPEDSEDCWTFRLGNLD